MLTESWAWDLDLTRETALGSPTLYYLLINYTSKPEGAVDLETQLATNFPESDANLISPFPASSEPTEASMDPIAGGEGSFHGQIIGWLSLNRIEVKIISWETMAPC